MLALMLMLTGLLIKDVKFSALKEREMKVTLIAHCDGQLFYTYPKQRILVE